jgi:hypothetical protein
MWFQVRRFKKLSWKISPKDAGVSMFAGTHYTTACFLLQLFSNLLMQNINEKQEYLCFASVSTYIGVWAKPTLRE